MKTDIPRRSEQHLQRLRGTMGYGVYLQGIYTELEKKMATQSSILAWKIPWTEEPGMLQFIGMQRVRHDLEIEHTHTHGRNVGHYFLK